MKALSITILFAAASTAVAGSIAIGAAPNGNTATVASRIIKENHPTCKRVTGAVRRADGAIQAYCNGASFLVFTVFNPKEGRTIELAMNCTAAKQTLDISC